MAWTEKYCKTHEGEDLNPEHLRYSREKKDEVWEYVVKMTIIFRDLMIGNPVLTQMGFEEEAMGHNAIAGGFQGQRQWTDFRPDGDFSEAHPQHVVRLERHPRGLHLRHRERHAQRRLDALHAPADQPSAALLRRALLLESRGRGTRHGQKADGQGRPTASSTSSTREAAHWTLRARCPTPLANP